MDYTFLSEICKRHGSELIYNCRLAPFTSFKIGGECDALVKINSVELLKELIKTFRSENIPFCIIGKGSNILISDGGFRGVVLLFSHGFANISVEGETITCDAGVSLTKLCVFAMEHSLKGLEFAYGIPGTAGGALYMNAGAYGGEIQDVIISARYMDENAEIKEIEASEMGFSYRHSIFTDSGKIILKLVFKLSRGNKDEISSQMEEIMQKRRDKQPLEYPSAGSTFKRPPGDYASRLVDCCGLKGFSVGGAEVSKKHSGFIINKGGATFRDVINIIDAVQKEVYRQTGVTLEPEIKIIGK